jgi:uncharacterized protein YpmS
MPITAIVSSNGWLVLGVVSNAAGGVKLPHVGCAKYMSSFKPAIAYTRSCFRS